jgi:hypothetical protein
VFMILARVFFLGIEIDAGQGHVQVFGAGQSYLQTVLDLR